jgi:hypothetical protein
MSDAMGRLTRTARILALGLATALVSVLLIAGPTAPHAQALDFYVEDEQDFMDAIAAANAVAGEHYIIFENDIEFTTDALRAFNHPSATVIIEGGDFKASCVNDEGCGRFFTADQIDELVILDLTIESFGSGAVWSIATSTIIARSTFQYNANDDGEESTDAYGGALVLVGGAGSGAYLDVRDSTFHANYVGTGEGNAYGAAVYLEANAYIENVDFTENIANSWQPSGSTAGAAIYVYDGDVSVTESHFAENQAQSSGDLSAGGAIAAVNSYVDIEYSTFSSNWAFGRGGAIAAAYSAVAVDDSLIDGNYATYWGGGIFTDTAYVEITETDFRANSAGQGGGAYSAWDTDGSINGSLFVQNSGFRGGALQASESELWTVSSTFTENDAYEGGAIWTSSTDMDLIHATIAGNTADDVGDSTDGGGQLGGQDGSYTISNSVIVDPIDSPSNCVYYSVTVTSDGYNVADDTTCGLGDASDVADPTVDAQLGPLKFNGGPTHTMVPAPESILIDAVTGQACASETADQRGVLRPQGDGCDIGAVETLTPILRDVVTPGGTVSVRILNAIEGEGLPTAEHIALNTLTPAAPAGVAFPYGGLGMQIAVWDDGWPVDVEIATPAPTSQFWKLIDGEWVQYPATRIGSTWSFRLIDGADGDTDGEANSVIVDPVAMGVGAAFTG